MGEQCLFGGCALFLFLFFTLREWWKREKWNQAEQWECTGEKKRSTYPLKRGKCNLTVSSHLHSDLVFPPHGATTQGPSPLYLDPSISRHRGCNLVPKPQLRQTFLINLLVLKWDDSVKAFQSCRGDRLSNT